jgi:hypothetical protein
MSSPEEPVDEREARLGRNEAIFRLVNDRMSDLNETFAAMTDGEFVIVCECSTVACVQQIVISETEYARVRSDPMSFVVFPGHEDPTLEAVVEHDRGTGYLVVRKHPGVPTDLAVENAPDS